MRHCGCLEPVQRELCARQRGGSPSGRARHRDKETAKGDVWHPPLSLSLSLSFSTSNRIFGAANSRGYIGLSNLPIV
jgi:hypothetical protein